MFNWIGRCLRWLGARLRPRAAVRLAEPRRPTFVEGLEDRQFLSVAAGDCPLTHDTEPSAAITMAADTGGAHLLGTPDVSGILGTYKGKVKVPTKRKALKSTVKITAVTPIDQDTGKITGTISVDGLGISKFTLKGKLHVDTHSFSFSYKKGNVSGSLNGTYDDYDHSEGTFVVKVGTHKTTGTFSYDKSA
jgi:hypothetical protein